MATLKVGQSISTPDPELIVDAGLPVGTYRFSLVVEDSSQNQSLPVETVVVVFRATVEPAPTRVVTGPTIIPTSGPTIAPIGTSTPIATPISTPIRRPIL